MNISKIKNVFALGVAVALAGGVVSSASAAATYHQGYETNADGWYGSGGITRVPSGGGTLGFPSSSGDYHAEIEGGGDFDHGYTYFGGSDTTYTGSFSQSLDLYVDAANWGVGSFKLTMAPTYTTGGTDYGAAEDYVFKTDGSGTVNVTANGIGGSSGAAGASGHGQALGPLNDSGWYTFTSTYTKAANGSDPVQINMKVSQGSTLFGSADLDAYHPSDDSTSAALGGHGLGWVKDSQDFFTDQTLAIDNAQVSVLSSDVPEPSSVGLLGLGLGILALLGLTRRRQRA